MYCAPLPWCWCKWGMLLSLPGKRRFPSQNSTARRRCHAPPISPAQFNKIPKLRVLHGKCTLRLHFVLDLHWEWKQGPQCLRCNDLFKQFNIKTTGIGQWSQAVTPSALNVKLHVEWVQRVITVNSYNAVGGAQLRALSQIQPFLEEQIKQV